MLVEDALRKYPNLVEWIVTSYSSTTSNEIQFELAGPWLINDRNRVMINQKVDDECMSRLDKIKNDFHFARWCTCLVNDCLIVWEEQKL